MFSHHYHSELSFIRQLVQAYSQTNPGSESILTGYGSDPDVERLLQGFAFLNAKLRERTEDAIPEIIHDLIELALPNFLRSLPSCSIVEFTPGRELIRGRNTTHAGTELTAKLVEGVACRFRTTMPIDLLPIEIENVALDNPMGSAPILRLRFSANSGCSKTVFQKEGIRLFLHGDLALTTTLRFWLLKHCRQVEVRSLINGAIVRLSSTCLSPVGFEHEHALLPWSKKALDAYRLVQEYFTLPQKFLFIDVLNLDLAQQVESDKFEISFLLETPPRLPGTIDQKTFRLHCTPVINLFDTLSEPMDCQLDGKEHLIRASGIPERFADVYNVEQVQGLDTKENKGRVYSSSMGSERLIHGKIEGPSYKVRRSLSLAGDSLEAYLSVTAPAKITKRDEIITASLTCTNGSLPGRLRIGDISGISIDVPYSNIIEVSKPILPPLGNGILWRLFGQLKASQQSVMTTDSLRESLELFHFQAFNESETTHANRQRINAIESVKSKVICCMVEGMGMSGFGVTVELQEKNFASTAEAYLFSSIIEVLLASPLTFNCFSKLSLRLKPLNKEFTWPPRMGSVPPL